MTIVTEPYSWTPPGLAWEDREDIYVMQIDLADLDLVKLMALGTCQSTYFATSMQAEGYAKLLGGKCLAAKTIHAINAENDLVPDRGSMNKPLAVSLNWHGTYATPDSQTVLVLISQNPPKKSLPSQFEATVTAASALYSEHLKALEIFNREREHRLARYATDKIDNPELARAFEIGEAMYPLCPPQITAEVLVNKFPKAIAIAAAHADIDSALEDVLFHASASGWNAPRDGVYRVISARDDNQTKRMVITWQPHDSLPAYPELRWTIQKSMPAAMTSPRLKISGKPRFSGNDDQKEPHRVCVGGTETQDWLEALNDLDLDDDDHDQRTAAISEGLKEDGFEAIAWYQPFHVWSEATWGIYMDARKLDDLALALWKDSKTLAVTTHSSGCRLSQDQSAQLAFGLVYHHELFHARVEAALTWMELISAEPRYLRYNQNVYKALLGKDELLEEALANWVSWDWFHQLANQASSPWKACSAIASKVVEATLDISPPGYRRWSVGHQKMSWRELITQMAQGHPVISGNLFLPLESLLSTTLPFDFRPSDVPLYFVGSGAIASRIQAHPSVFNVPAKKEIEHVLRSYSYVKSAAKGSHEKWTGPDSRAFVLPQRDPVSRGVFKSFLHHFGMNKSEYAEKIRSRL